MSDSLNERFEAWKHQMEGATSDKERFQVIEALLGEYLTYIQMLARPQLGPSQRVRFDSEDIRQSISWRVADRLRDGRIQLMTEPQFKRLLKTMVRNLLQDRAIRHPEPSLDAPRSANDSVSAANIVPANEPTASSEVSAAELRREIWSEIERLLQPDELYLFREHHIEGATYAELAERLGISPDAVRMRLARARERLQQQLTRFQDLFDD